MVAKAATQKKGREQTEFERSRPKKSRFNNQKQTKKKKTTKTKKGTQKALGKHPPKTLHKAQHTPKNRLDKAMRTGNKSPAAWGGKRGIVATRKWGRGWGTSSWGQH